MMNCDRRRKRERGSAGNVVSLNPDSCLGPLFPFPSCWEYWLLTSDSCVLLKTYPQPGELPHSRLHLSQGTARDQWLADMGIQRPGYVLSIWDHTGGSIVANSLPTRVFFRKIIPWISGCYRHFSEHTSSEFLLSSHILLSQLPLH